MNSVFRKYNLFRRKRRRRDEVFPDEIFADSSNMPDFDTDQFEGRLERPISRWAVGGVAAAALLIGLLFAGRAWFLQVDQGTAYAAEATGNTLHSTPIFASRGLVYDRNGVELAWNAPGPDDELDATSSADEAVPEREYATSSGLSQILGYIQYPSKDSSGFYYQEDFVGMDGVEKYFNDTLEGQNGLRLLEADARGNVVSADLVKPPTAGQNVTLSIDSRVEGELYDNIKSVADTYGFTGGSGVIMNVRTGEVVAMTSYPQYDSQVMSDKDDVSAIKAYLNDPGNPFLNRAVNGLYAPGSTVKPYVALGALNENIIDPSTKILSTGSISLPNPYDPSNPSVFVDWRPQGWVDMEDALAVSSDVYFYEVGGGFQSQPGLGITKLDQYFGMFGFGQPVPSGSFFSGVAGLVPSPAWKAQTFPTDPTWRIGDTYHTAIGQYGFQVSPVQMVRAVAALANGGTLLDPSILKTSTPGVYRTTDLPGSYFQTVRAGLRQGVTSPLGTDGALDVSYADLAAKSGTAQVGVNNQFDNSWITGFWPYEDPEYAFAVVMEHGPIANDIGGAAVMRYTLDWMDKHTPEYFATATSS